ncbi:MAG TPA: hypothetical protein DCG75_05145 [Bacteroidales bacterium]|jgi:hypothetical protein|nr:hypothetical protein [Bacteroidales bacterium]
MNCKEFKNILSIYHDDLLTQKQKEEFQSHINSCSECSILFNNFSRTFNLLHSKSEIEDQPFYFTRLKQRMGNRNMKDKSLILSLFSKKLVQPLIYLSSLIIAVYIGILIGSGSVNPNQYTELKNNETDFIKSYAEYQYLNDFDIEPIETLLLEENKNTEE